jgi:hypothetical protein
LQRVTQTHEVIAESQKLLSDWGLQLDDPLILSDAGNLTLWLRPHPIVARVATLFSGDDADFWGAVWQRELRVAAHLMHHNVPIVAPTTVVPAGPHRVAGTWMTLWDYAQPVECPPLGMDGVAMVSELTRAMGTFPEPLPRWGPWMHVEEAVERLRPMATRDTRVGDVIREVEHVAQRMKDHQLFPAHGDAHPGNLLPTPNGWRWIDFEDVSLMPRFWDLASFIANTALLEGIDHPIVVQACRLDDVAKDPEAFWWVVRARVVMSLSTNLGLSLARQGDRGFAFRQLERWPKFLHDWPRYLSDEIGR